MYLLDTHTMLWYLANSPQLSPLAKSTITQEDCAVHIISFWEIAIKQSLGKLQITTDISMMIAELTKQQIPIVAVSELAINQIKTLPFHHRDPFDRMLIAETLIQQWSIISIDGKFDAYSGLKRIW